ncbi:MAG: endonuclease MutS2 [Oscillospiraceae bacterium]|nr:endonuclease MutS2 [Oscillospiraceae bacterium]
MMDLQQKSMRILELSRILAMLADCAQSAEGKAWTVALIPANNMHDAQCLLDETANAYDCIGTQGSPSFAGLRPVKDIVKRANDGGVLSTGELLQVADLLRTARGAKSYASEDKAGNVNHLSKYFSALQPIKRLEDAITTAILGEDEIADHASPELANIRRKKRIAASKVREVLQKIVSSRSKVLQDAVITQRGGRFVVPVRNEHKNDVPGLVHDVSSSGATFFIEPQEVVTLNNEIHEWEAAERAEIERILAALSRDVSEVGDAILMNHDMLLALDCIFARAKLAYEMYASRPTLTENGALSLSRARHPLLDRKIAVPITVTLGETFDTLIVTGPNTGGKTVALKTIGLLSLMAACGLFITADDGSQVPLYRAVLADIGDEQSIEQSLSTFSAHMTNIVAILAQSGQNTLVLFDELGAGTDPVEGAALARSIIEYARSQGAVIAATTHYAELKAFALTTAGVENAACEFDVDTLKPTYRLLLGVPGKSNAFAISRRLGLPEHIVTQAVRHIETGDAAVEDVVAALDSQRKKLEDARQTAEEHARLAGNKRAEWDRLAREIENERQKAAEKAQTEAHRILDEARAAADLVHEEIAALRRKANKGSFDTLQEARTSMKRQLNETEKALQIKRKIAAKPKQCAIQVGDTVEMLKLGGQATVIKLPDKDGKVELQAGILKVKAHVDELQLIERERVTVEAKNYGHGDGSSNEPTFRTAPQELLILGKNVDEALPEVDAYLDSAVMAKMETARIVHGKGTGVLRSAVHGHLKGHRQVKAFRLGRYGEGEDGVTVVTLK